MSAKFKIAWLRMAKQVSADDIFAVIALMYWPKKAKVQKYCEAVLFLSLVRVPKEAQ